MAAILFNISANAYVNRCVLIFISIYYLLLFTLLSLKQINQDKGSRERKEYASEASLAN